MATPISGQVSDREKRYIRDRLRRALDPGTFDPKPADGFPGVIAGPPTGNPFTDFQRRAGRRICDIWAAGGRPQIVPYRDSYYRELCDPYLGPNAPSDPTTAPPFEGGQCPDVRYTFEWTRTQNGIPGPNGIFDLIGPLSLITEGDNTGTASCPPGQTFSSITMRGANNTSVSLTTGCDVTATVFAVYPTFGGPNNCGSPAPEFKPGDPTTPPTPTPGPVGGPTGYPFPNFDIDILPDGTIEVDFGDGSPPEVFDPAEGEGGGGGGGGAPTNPGSPGPSGDTGDGGESSGQAGEGEELVGVLVEILSSHENANTVDRAAVPVFRGIGYVAMGYPGLLGVDTSAAVVSSPQFFHAQQRGLTNWRVRANLGFNLRSTPYYRETTS